MVELRRLVRQRARWFQGNLQCWARIPEIVRSGLPLQVVVDLLFQLLAASLVLVMSAASVAFLTALGLTIARNPHGAAHLLPGHYGLPLVGLYLLAFGSALIYGPVYWLRDRDSSLIKSIAYAHLFTAYAYMWVPAGWRAVWRTVWRRQDWAKTTRSAEIVQEAYVQ